MFPSHKPEDPGDKRELTPKSYPLTSTWAPWNILPSTNITHTQPYPTHTKQTD